MMSIPWRRFGVTTSGSLKPNRKAKLLAIIVFGSCANITQCVVISIGLFGLRCYFVDLSQLFDFGTSCPLLMRRTETQEIGRAHV